jgi:prepilin-type N-terminal cleavage/methylation domain-containing protein
MKDFSSEKGFSIIEILISSVIISTVTLMVILSVQLYINISRQNRSNIQSAILFEETSEVIQMFRDESWENEIASLNLDTEYHLDWDGSQYIATSTPILIDDKFERTFSLSEVERDINDTIVESGNVDSDTFLVTITVSWDEEGETESEVAEMLIHNSYSN